MHRTHISSSSAISSVGYDERSAVLEVEFSSGTVYDYFKVPEKVYRDLLKAPSKGSFVSRRVRDRYSFVRRDS
jgi:KTSC domain